MAEAGAEVVAADALLTRVAAYYHDVGKLTNPLMFKENQMNVANPPRHDDAGGERPRRYGGILPTAWRWPRRAGCLRG